MADKTRAPAGLPSIEELAKQEVRAEAERVARIERNRANAARASAALPERFFALAGEVRALVQRFNQEAIPDRRLKYEESVMLAARPPSLEGDYHLVVRREQAEARVMLSSMLRPLGPDAYIIEVAGTLKDKPFRTRTACYGTDDGVVYRTWVNGQPVAWPDEELAERIVRTVVQCDLDAAGALGPK